MKLAIFLKSSPRQLHKGNCFLALCKRLVHWFRRGHRRGLLAQQQFLHRRPRASTQSQRGGDSAGIKNAGFIAAYFARCYMVYRTVSVIGHSWYPFRWWSGKGVEFFGVYCIIFIVNGVGNTNEVGNMGLDQFCEIFTILNERTYSTVKIDQKCIPHSQTPITGSPHKLKWYQDPQTYIRVKCR